MVKMSESQPKNYILLGPPGSGKSTQATILKNKYRLAHIDVGSELRRLAESGTDLGKTIHQVINVKKELVSDGLIGDVVAHILTSLSQDQGVLLDGAPRRISQVDEVEKALADRGRTVEKVIFLDLSEKTAIERISKRFLCQECKAPYIGSWEEIKILEACTVCGGVIGQRPDDTKEGVAKRYAVFVSDTRPVVENYQTQGKLVRIDAELPYEDIARSIEESL